MEGRQPNPLIVVCHKYTNGAICDETTYSLWPSGYESLVSTSLILMLVLPLRVEPAVVYNSILIYNVTVSVGDGVGYIDVVDKINIFNDIRGAVIAGGCGVIVCSLSIQVAVYKNEPSSSFTANSNHINIRAVI